MSLNDIWQSRNRSFAYWNSFVGFVQAHGKIIERNKKELQNLIQEELIEIYEKKDEDLPENKEDYNDDYVNQALKKADQRVFEISGHCGSHIFGSFGRHHLKYGSSEVDLHCWWKYLIAMIDGTVPVNNAWISYTIANYAFPDCNLFEVRYV